MRRRRALVGLGVALLGCHRAPARVESCRDNLGGVWRAEGDARFRYRISDDGRQVTLWPLYAAGGPGTGYGSARTVLVRTAAGTLAGATETTYSESGKTCPLRFQARIDRCGGGKLELAGETNFDIEIATCTVHSSGVLQVATLVREGDR
ncbi:MAG TPA: hypothetical protein VKN99_12750 [Polyangia bacterium]|nr:hypothetical protein [Polyangia bacterium]